MTTTSIRDLLLSARADALQRGIPIADTEADVVDGVDAVGRPCLFLGARVVEGLAARGVLLGDYPDGGRFFLDGVSRVRFALQVAKPKPAPLPPGFMAGERPKTRDKWGNVVEEASPPNRRQRRAMASDYNRQASKAAKEKAKQKPPAVKRSPPSLIPYDLASPPPIESFPVIAPAIVDDGGFRGITNLTAEDREAIGVANLEELLGLQIKPEEMGEPCNSSRALLLQQRPRGLAGEVASGRLKVDLSKTTVVVPMQDGWRVLDDGETVVDAAGNVVGWTSDQDGVFVDPGVE